jgi:TPR repeat protein
MNETPSKMEINRWYRRGKRAYYGRFKNHFEIAVQWLEKAAKAGNKYAQYLLGMCYLRGEGVPKDDYTAYSWFRESGKNGHPDGRYLADDMLRVHEMML